jgi:DNA repair exonuclease SbcCD ATPase subunit
MRKREFIANIEEANSALAELDNRFAALEASFSEADKRREAAESRANDLAAQLSEIESRVNLLIGENNDLKAKLEKSDEALRAASQQSVVVAATVGVPAVTNSPIDQHNSNDRKSQLTGMQRVAAAFESMQPKSLKGK